MMAKRNALGSQLTSSAYALMKNSDLSSATRVLIYRLGSLGDMIVSLPSLHLIARRFPYARRLLLTNVPVNQKAPAAAAILNRSGLVDGYIRYSVGTRNPIYLARLWLDLVLFRPEVLIYLMPVPINGEKDLWRNIAFFRSAGINTFIGVPWGDLMIHQVDSNTGLYEHEAARLARALTPLGSADLGDSKNWSLKLTDEEHSMAALRLDAFAGEPFIACSVGTKAQAKDWTLPNWIALLRRLKKEYPHMGLLLIGAPEERIPCNELATVWGGKALNVCGEFSPRESAAALCKARFFIGHDSGPLHLAASVKVPTIGIYAARNPPGIWFPYGDAHKVLYHQVDCAGCNLSTCVDQRKKCILSISVDEVMNAINSLALP